MELRQLQYFTAIYEEGSVTRASQRLNVVQPAISQQISKLEEELGRQLFSRTPKGMVPTEHGAEAYQLFSGILRDLRSACQQLEEDDGQVRGTVTLGVVTSVANNALVDTLLGFHKKYPDVHVRATGGYTGELSDMLRGGQLDLIIINVPPQARTPEMTDIICEDLVLIGAAGTPLPLPEPVDYARINDVKLVIPSARHGLRTILDRAASSVGVNLAPQMEFDDLKPIEDFVMNSEFFTILPPLAVSRALRSGQLKAYRITPAIPRRLVCITAPDRPLSRAATLLVDELRERMIDFSYDVSVSLEDKDAPA
ncbi:LysR family transcriptional regulator [Salipiger abyssi]|uniref:LysR family transcriptional regulator n=1 Tax=Salipiger abyssi TaxID=1250539 RepID=UPI001A8C7E46|nr:LysR family transcriptional regulator [Salipiger abyssi]MBN9887856.1 LysR family transcriptional regulator [Salipiger abyssi]